MVKDVETQAPEQQRRRKRMLWGGLLVAIVLVAGAAIALGLVFGLRDNSSASVDSIEAAPAPSPAPAICEPLANAQSVGLADALFAHTAPSRCSLIPDKPEPTGFDVTATSACTLALSEGGSSVDVVLNYQSPCEGLITLDGTFVLPATCSLDTVIAQGTIGNVTTLNAIEGCSAVVVELRATVTPGTMTPAPAPATMTPTPAPAPAPMPVEAPAVPAPAPAPVEPEWPKMPVKPYPNTPGLKSIPFLNPELEATCALRPKGKSMMCEDGMEGGFDKTPLEELSGMEDARLAEDCGYFNIRQDIDNVMFWAFGSRKCTLTNYIINRACVGTEGAAAGHWRARVMVYTSDCGYMCLKFRGSGTKLSNDYGRTESC